MIKSTAAVATKILLVLGILAISSSGVWASTIPCVGDPASPTTLGGLLGMGQAGYSGCLSQDKIYSNFSNGTGTPLPTAWNAVISYYANFPVNGQDLHVFNLSENTSPGGGAIGPGTYTLDYLISIDPGSPNYNLNWITSVQVSGDYSSGDASDTKGLYAPTYNADGVFTGPGAYIGSVTAVGGVTASIGVGVKAVYVEETITIGSSTLGHSITDSFIETLVPEPATMALMGAGLLALGGLLRRKKLAK